MTQRMWRNQLLDPGSSHVLPQDLPRPHARKGVTARVEKEVGLPGTPLQERPLLPHVDRERADGISADRHEPLFAPLPENAHESFIEPDVLHTDADPFGDAQSRPIRYFEHRTVPKVERVVHRGSRQQALDLIHGKHFRERTPPLRRVEAFAWIAYDVTISHQESEIAAHRGDVAPNRRWRKAEILQLVHELSKNLGRDRDGCIGALDQRKVGEARHVACVGFLGSHGRALLQRKKIGKALEQERAMPLVRRYVFAFRLRTSNHAPIPRARTTVAPIPIVLLYCKTVSRSRSQSDPTRN